MEKRIPLWDNVKCILIVLVVVGHFVGQVEESPSFLSLFLFIYSFHMPLFIFISGLFHKNTRIAEKVLAYLLIYLVLKLCVFYVNYCFGHNINFYLFREDGIPWFMLATAVFILITWFTRNMNRRYLLLACIFLACLAGYDKTVGDDFVLSRIIVYYPFYLLGTMMDREKLERFSSSGKVRILAVVVFAVWLYLCFFHRDSVGFLRSLFTGRNAYTPRVRPLGLFARLFCYVFTSLLGLSLISLTPRRKLPLITDCGRKTLQIYFWHRLIIHVLCFLGVHRALCASHPGKILWCLLAVLCTFLLSLSLFSFPTKHILSFSRKCVLPPARDTVEEDRKDA